MMIGYKRKILSGIWETIWWITHVFIVYNRMNDFAGTVHESMEKFFESNIRNSSAMYVFLWNRRECRFKKKIPDCNVHVNKFLCDYSITNHKKHGNHNVLYLNRIHVKDEKNLGCLVFKCYVGQKTKSSCGKRKWANYLANLLPTCLQRDLIRIITTVRQCYHSSIEFGIPLSNPCSLPLQPSLDPCSTAILAIFVDRVNVDEFGFNCSPTTWPPRLFLCNES